MCRVIACTNQEEAEFEVVWTHQDPTTQQWEMGLHCLERKARLWRKELGVGLDPEDFRHLLRDALAETACINRIRQKH